MQVSSARRILSRNPRYCYRARKSGGEAHPHVAERAQTGEKGPSWRTRLIARMAKTFWCRRWMRAPRKRRANAHWINFATLVVRKISEKRCDAEERRKREGGLAWRAARLRVLDKIRCHSASQLRAFCRSPERQNAKQRRVVVPAGRPVQPSTPNRAGSSDRGRGRRR